MASNRKALGRGIDALIPTPSPATESESGVQEVEVDLIERNPDQPRTRFDDESLAELAASIKTHGVLQPVLITPSGGGRYRLVVGERRLRAAKLAGADRVPAVVREVDETGSLELALIENLQREDLNPIDEARGYEALMEASALTQVQVADRVGKDRSTVANALRLLALIPDVQEMVASGILSSGHARAIVGLGSVDEQRALAEKAVRRGLSVREVESMVRGKKGKRRAARAKRTDDPVTREWEERLQRTFGTLVRIDRMGDEGTIRIEYYSQEDLERILEILGSAEHH